MSFQIIPGHPDSPVILHVPHASRTIVDSGLLPGPAALADELDHLTDAYTDVIAARAADHAPLRPWTLVNRLSRLVVDPERFPDDTEEMLAVGMGPVYTHGYAGRRLRNDDPARDQALLDEHFHPYAAAMSTLTDQRLAATGRAILLDVHSYPAVPLPYEMHGDGPRPHLCLGTDPDHTPGRLIALARELHDDTALNSPFAGCYVPLAHWRRDTRVAALMLEIRRDVYMREPAGPPTGGIDTLAAGLGTLINAVTRRHPADGIMTP
ncbi:N-formylglutamate amidohydrolase [Actinoplanes rectilineatus]|uniref:N-formylglutamate amidohydrolase n=1 Tax=Actinoplanes rectilineatus TaxID=113571 RepID=UPI0005F2CF0D|nr:N-formylglutamate amidohydrolase [Actinoplanes rectilineatus]